MYVFEIEKYSATLNDTIDNFYCIHKPIISSLKIKFTRSLIKSRH